MRRQIAAVSVLLVFVGCTAPRVRVTPSLDTIDIPERGVMLEAQLGETVVAKGRRHTRDAMDLRNEVTGATPFLPALLLAPVGILMYSINRVKVVIPPQRLIAKEQDFTWRHYFPENVEHRGLFTRSDHPTLAVKRADKSQVRVFPYQFIPKPQPDFELVTVTDPDGPDFRRELIYSGRSSDALQFLYRESSYETAQGDSSQAIKHDLSEDAIFELRGLRIEIVEATDTKLRYRVLSSFADEDPKSRE